MAILFGLANRQELTSHQELRTQVLNRRARIHDHLQGHGLGLGIVRDIVGRCTGELSLHESPRGDLQVVIRLPAPNS